MSKMSLEGAQMLVLGTMLAVWVIAGCSVILTIAVATYLARLTGKVSRE